MAHAAEVSGKNVDVGNVIFFCRSINTCTFLKV